MFSNTRKVALSTNEFKLSQRYESLGADSQYTTFNFDSILLRS